MRTQNETKWLILVKTGKVSKEYKQFSEEIQMVKKYEKYATSLEIK